MSTNDIDQLAGKFMDFIDKCPSPYHVCQYMKEKLLEAGFIEIDERKIWPEGIKKGFVIRDFRSIIVFNVNSLEKAVLASAHNDFHSIKIIQRHESQQVSEYVSPVQNYGNPLWDSYADRSLRIGGIVSYINDNKKLDFKLIDSEKAVASFPNLAIHLRGKGYGYRFSPGDNYVSFGHASINDVIANVAKLDSNKIKDHDLFLVDSQPSRRIADLITGGRIDNFASCFAVLESFLNSSTENPNSATQIMSIFDRSLIDGDTAAGTNSTFLEDVLDYIFDEKLDEVRDSIFHVSCDHAEANHPSFPDFYNPDQKILMSKGLAIKKSLRADLATDNITQFIITQVAKDANAPTQIYMCRNMQIMSPSAGTNITANSGLRTADVGIPILSIGSARQTASATDLYNYTQILTKLFSNYGEYYRLLP